MSPRNPRSPPAEAGVSQVPGHSPDWTDHNPHDPGITVLELLAYSILALAFTAVVVTAISRARTRCRRTG
jgi:hypothetical protein